ncbi:DUF3263 domain-containing protein [Nocardioides zeae]|uniref:Uncharacterized protein n=1 Tax=Nocardioides zeae TaxID=1457234 RepID=A0AAJ1TWV0_9ACTN|nr:hypothetical protein [Nocardioides zeae]
MSTTTETLIERHRDMLEFERSWWKYQGVKD